MCPERGDGLKARGKKRTSVPPLSPGGAGRADRGEVGCEQAAGRTPFKSRGDYEDSSCSLSALIKLMELASWHASSALEKENKKSVFSERARGPVLPAAPGDYGPSVMASLE